MVLFGLLSLAYGIFFMYVRMFAIFDPELTTFVGVVAVVTGAALLVVARRSLRATSAQGTAVDILSRATT